MQKIRISLPARRDHRQRTWHSRLSISKCVVRQDRIPVCQEKRGARSVVARSWQHICEGTEKTMSGKNRKLAAAGALAIAAMALSSGFCPPRKLSRSHQGCLLALSFCYLARAGNLPVCLCRLGRPFTRSDCDRWRWKRADVFLGWSRGYGGNGGTHYLVLSDGH